MGEYQNDQASIKLYGYKYENTSVYVADIIVSSSEYIRTAFANDYYGKNVTAKTSDTAQQNNAVLAINGDYYGAWCLRSLIILQPVCPGRSIEQRDGDCLGWGVIQNGKVDGVVRK